MPGVLMCPPGGLPWGSLTLEGSVSCALLLHRCVEVGDLRPDAGLHSNAAADAPQAVREQLP